MTGAPIVKLDAGSLGNIAESTATVESKLGSPIGGIGNVISSLDWKVKADANIEGRLNELKKTLQVQESSLNAMRSIVDAGVEKIDLATGNLNKKTNAIAMKAAANAQNCMGGLHADTWKPLTQSSITPLALSLIGTFHSLSMIPTNVASNFTNFFSSWLGGGLASGQGNSGGGNSGGGLHDSGDHGAIEKQFTDENGVTWATYEDGTVEALYATHNPNINVPVTEVEEYGPTRDYKYNDNNYKVVGKYRDDIDLYQQDYAIPIVNGGSDNGGCRACCVCMAYNMMNGTDYKITGKDGKGKNGEIVPDDQSIRYINGHDHSNPVYEDGGRVKDDLGLKDHPEVKAKTDKKTGELLEPLKDPDGTKRLSIIEKEIASGKPAMIGVNKDGSNKTKHYVLVIGIVDPHDTPPKQSQLLVVDPARSEKNNPVCLTDTKYRLAGNGNVWTY